MDVTGFPDPRSIAVVAALAVALWFKGLWLSLVQVRARWRARAFQRPEDARMLGLPPGEEPAIVARAAAAWRNELENSPLFLITAVIAALAGVRPGALAGVGAVFVLARALHGHAQVGARQPLRTIAWLAGVAAHAALVALVVAAVWRGAV